MKKIIPKLAITTDKDAHQPILAIVVSALVIAALSLIMRTQILDRFDGAPLQANVVAHASDSQQDVQLSHSAQSVAKNTESK